MGVLECTLLLWCFLHRVVTSDDIVTTTTGKIQGVTLPPPHSNVEAFLGIPYAEPPVGNLRFRRTVPKLAWSGIYNASKKGPACMQMHVYLLVHMEFTKVRPEIEKSEDCLYLNVWAPKNRNDTSLKPTFVYIHGGSWLIGSGNEGYIDGAIMSSRGDIIVVTFNYRLGAFGLFTSLTEAAEGNMLFYDQITALKWIKDNAMSFGGDPDRITIGGESAGSVSASALLISPLAKGLFRNIIMQSGSIISPYLYNPNNEDIYKLSNLIAKSAGCSNNSMTLKTHPDLIVECLRTIPAEKLVESDVVVFNKYHMTYTMRLGDSFMPSNPSEVYRCGNFKDTKALTGLSRDEGTVMFLSLLSNFLGAERIHEMDKDMAYIMIHILMKGFRIQLEKQKSAFYMAAVDNGTGSVPEALSNFLGDYIINCATIFNADLFSLKDSVYFYMFEHRSSFSMFPEWMGVEHSTELPYVFGTTKGYSYRDFSKEEKSLSERVMNRWIAFIKTGNPNIPGATKWPAYTYRNPQYLAISMEDNVNSHPLDGRCDIWRTNFNAKIEEVIMKSIKPTD